MTNNDLLRRLRYALKLDATAISEIFALAGYETGAAEVLKLLKKEDEQGFVPCTDEVLHFFLDGLITSRRGRRDEVPAAASPAATRFTNNLILRKLRIALELNEEKMVAVVNAAGVDVSRSELSAMFRAAGHRNYKQCGDQFLRNFIRGLTVAYGSMPRTAAARPGSQG